MRKNLFKIAVLCLTMTTGCISFSSCSSNNDDEPIVVTNEITTIKTVFSATLSSDWYKFFDIEVTYTSKTGTKTIILTQDWVYNYDIPYSTKPEKIICNVVAKPKANAPAIEKNVNYLLKQDINAVVNGLRRNGSVDPDYGYIGTNIGFENLNSVKMEEKLKKEQIIILSFSFTTCNE